MFKIKFTKSFAKDLKKIPNEAKEEFYEKWLTRIQEDPKIGNRFAGKKLKNHLKLAFRYKKNDYRVVYQVHKKEILVVLLAIGSRENFYKRLNRKNY